MPVQSQVFPAKQNGDSGKEKAKESMTERKSSFRKGVHGICRAMCSRHYPQNIYYGSSQTGKLLTEGWRKCTVCELVMLTNDKFCGCCGCQTGTRTKRHPVKK